MRILTCCNSFVSLVLPLGMPIFQKHYIIPNRKISSGNTFFMEVYKTGEDAKLLKLINDTMEFTVWGFIKINKNTTPVVPPFSSPSKSDNSTKHYFTQMLLDRREKIHVCV